MQLIDIIPITYTKYPSSKRPNRISRADKLIINKMYVDFNIKEIADKIGKSPDTIEKYLKNNKLI